MRIIPLAIISNSCIFLYHHTFKIVIILVNSYITLKKNIIVDINTITLKRFFFIFTWGHFPIVFRERGREREKHALIGHLLYSLRLGIIPAWTRDGTRHPGMCPEQESNLQPFSYGTILQPTEPHRPGWKHCIIRTVYSKQLFVTNPMFGFNMIQTCLKLSLGRCYLYGH